jgi:hypothetical protein
MTEYNELKRKGRRRRVDEQAIFGGRETRRRAAGTDGYISGEPFSRRTDSRHPQTNNRIVA